MSKRGRCKPIKPKVSEDDDDEWLRSAKTSKRKEKVEKQETDDDIIIIKEILHPAPIRASTPRKSVQSTLDKTLEWPFESEEKMPLSPPPLSPNDSIFNESFEQLPKKKEKPKGLVVVRKKAERQKLPGHTCKCCEKYFDGLGLNPEEKQKRINHVSRHRANAPRPKTPEHFWDLDFPSTPEMLARGYWKQLWKTDGKDAK